MSNNGSVIVAGNYTIL